MRLRLTLALVAFSSPLHAQACPEPEARQFDSWLGSWNVDNRYLVNGAWRDIGPAEVEVTPVAGGCGVLELWDGMMGSRRVRGLSVRAWSPGDSSWTLALNWPSAAGAGFSTLAGRVRPGRGNFFGQVASGHSLTRCSFADIWPGRSRWNDGASADSGATWRTQRIMEYSRRATSLRAPFNAALATLEDDPICAADAQRAADPLLGRWREAGRPEEVFVVLGQDRGRGARVGWTLSTLHRGFQRLQGPTSDRLSAGGALGWARAAARRPTVEWTEPTGAIHRLELRRLLR